MIVEIEENELNSLRAKAEAYDEMIKKRSLGGKISAQKLTPEERSARAKKAVQARIAKYLETEKDIKREYLSYAWRRSGQKNTKK